MVGIILFPTKPVDKEYEYKKDPKGPLKLSDDEIMQFAKYTKGIYYSFHLPNDLDDKTDEEIMRYLSQKMQVSTSDVKKLRGIDSGYSTSDGKKYIKVIKGKEEMFRRYFAF